MLLHRGWKVVFLSSLDQAKIIEQIGEELQFMSKNDYNFSTLLTVLIIIIIMMGLGALGALMMFLSAFM